MTPEAISRTVTHMTTHSPQQRLATHLLGEPVRAYIARHRRAGASWRLIARQLARDTREQVDVSDSTVRLWAIAADMPPDQEETS